MAGKILDVLVIRVDDVGELAAVHRLLKHPHVDRGVEALVLGSVGTHDLGDGGAPADTVGGGVEKSLFLSDKSQYS